MVNALVFFGWLAPILVPILSYLSFRLLPSRRERLQAYLLLLLLIMVLDMFGFSLSKDWMDSVVRMAVWFMVTEFFWLFTLMKNKTAVTVVMLVGGVLYLLANLGWLRAGPAAMPGVWDSSVVSSYHARKDIYFVKERNAAKRFGEPARRFVLQKQFPNLPLERRINGYTTPQGYSRSQFSFRWNETDKGVRTDVVVDGGVIWTLGEGF
jgi:hypothetical protein